jgi:NTE family protein
MAEERSTSEPLSQAGVPEGVERGKLEDGIGIALSGGGYRAMVFHVGALWRLLDAGILPKAARISSVSGGSITAGVLALAWPRLGMAAGGDRPAFQQGAFAEHVVAPVRAMASRTLDSGSILTGVFMPGTVGEQVAKGYDKHLFHGATLQDLPDAPRFVLNATNVQSGVLWRFSKPYMGDWRVGLVPSPRVPLAVAVAASSAFPPVLSPVTLPLDAAAFTPGSGYDLQKPPYTTDAVLSDGGVYDNLGIETLWKRYRTVLVSDAGAKFAPEPEPEHDWARHSYRILSLVDSQVRALRYRQIMEAFTASPPAKAGTYWGIRTNIADYGLADPLVPATPDTFARSSALAATPTRLKAMEDTLQERLINWGYAVSDAALRRYFDKTLPRPAALPYPAAGL